MLVVPLCFQAVLDDGIARLTVSKLFTQLGCAPLSSLENLTSDSIHIQQGIAQISPLGAHQPLYFATVHTQSNLTFS